MDFCWLGLYDTVLKFLLIWRDETEEICELEMEGNKEFSIEI